jgi:Kelch motif
MIKVQTETILRFFSIGWRKKFQIRELLKLIVTGLKDEHNLDEILGETADVGKLQFSRVNFSVVTNLNEIFIIGGIDEYKHNFVKQVEVIQVGNKKGTSVKVTSEFPQLRIGRIGASTLVIKERYLYVFQPDLEFLDLYQDRTKAAF